MLDQRGDTDDNGTIDFLTDFVEFRNAFANGGPNPFFDFNTDGLVDFLNDFVAFRNHFSLTP